MQHSPYAHRAVLENDAQEAFFPEHFKNPYLKTPRWDETFAVTDRLIEFYSVYRVWNLIARQTWLQHGETPVKNRIADNIPRKEIFKLLTHAGLVRREDFPYA